MLGDRPVRVKARTDARQQARANAPWCARSADIGIK
jgi:hypothetical protein